MSNLKNILLGVDVVSVYGDVDVDINHLVFDTRLLKEADVFLAIKGFVVDGHEFIEGAISLGAVVVVCEDLPSKLKDSIVYIQVADSHEALAAMAANFYGNPSQKLKLVGVTGTNGKTTVTSLLYQLFTKSGYKVGLLSTVNILVADKEYKTTHTTPDSVSINKYLAKMVEQGCEYCFMEVSSHGIAQKRTSNLCFEGGVFTNLSHDHLDYHHSFAEYRDVKKKFFDELPKTAFSLVNIDDKNGSVMLQNTVSKKYSYALKTIGDYKAKILEKSFLGTLLTVNGVEVWSKLIGVFNTYNLLAVFGVAELMGLEKMEILRLISELESVNGRFQYSVLKEITAIVDYAHTPDALKNVLETIVDIRTDKQQIITVVGCGGDRDVTKRPKMAHISSQLSDQVIFTSDNPRTEDPNVIIKEMELGVAEENQKKTLSILDREQAIKTACRLANTGDIVLVAGKGHEDYQEINGERNHFNDYEHLIVNLKNS